MDYIAEVGRSSAAQETLCRHTPLKECEIPIKKSEGGMVMEKITASIAAVSASLAASKVAAYSPNTVQTLVQEVPYFTAPGVVGVFTAMALVSPAYDTDT